MDLSISLPDWAIQEQNKLPEFLPRVEDQMREVIRFSQWNIDHQTGGPFAAGIFERHSGKRIMLGVNRVVPLGISSAHAEIVTLSMAQRLLGSWNLGDTSMPEMQLVVNWRPCAMCYGAVIWSGVRSLVIAGSDDACESITGFDEGPIHPQWKEELIRRGISVQDNVLYEQAIEVFKRFRDAGYLVYNGRSKE
jgi:tRNA(Arg) A34 adenosine deaminase TadA